MRTLLLNIVLSFLHGQAEHKGVNDTAHSEEAIAHAWLAAYAAQETQLAAFPGFGTKCNGDKNLPSVSDEHRCYSGSAGALGVTESIFIKLVSYDAAQSQGTITMHGEGPLNFKCTTPHTFTKSGQVVSVDVHDCLPSYVHVKSVNYCSDADEIWVTVSDSKVPIPLPGVHAKKVDCPKEEVASIEHSVAAQEAIAHAWLSAYAAQETQLAAFPGFGAKCKGDKNLPTVSDEHRCYSGSAGALGVTESIFIKLVSYDAAQSQGTITMHGEGPLNFKCTTPHTFTKSGQVVSVDVHDCLPSYVHVKSVNYCSDTDEIWVTVSDSKVPIPLPGVHAKKVDCPKDAQVEREALVIV
eukprot:TRINITY_DN2725_c0_g1_i1.p1 TRINITY_DN2725_c0_g1~~TRINITY_DN2725_c0_g1_i1.p1  ORF type:complete len:373 (+),score=49.44 TRINITY_DN2725_c0_g1_i1:63-1121(+)